MKPFDYCVFIGRFQPFHQAHSNILQNALNHSERVVVVLGSANKARDIKNPWSFSERIEMIKNSLSPEHKGRVLFIPQRDYLYSDNMWISSLQNQINEITGHSKNVALIGFESDRSSYYLKLFPRWQFLKCPTHYPIHATTIRTLYFYGNNEYKKYLAPDVAKYLEDFKDTEQYKNLCEEQNFLDNYKKLWEVAPYPPTFVTTDAVCIKSGHVLVVRRRGNPGRGLLALPGGFIKDTEFITDSAIRELKEETGIKVLPDILRSSIVDSKVFDSPERSLRGRTISHAYCIDLKSGPLPVVKGESDADKAFWMPLSEFYVRESDFFEDHWHIIYYFCSRY